MDRHARERSRVRRCRRDVPVKAFVTSRTWVADATFKWTAPGDTRRRYLKLQGEYLDRTEDGSLAFDVTGLAASGDYRSRQSGWYVQLSLIHISEPTRLLSISYAV